ncbi:MAG: hypothetical protein WDO74_10240 [Pseudomonadota bacterium]
MRWTPAGVESRSLAQNSGKVGPMGTLRVLHTGDLPGVQGLKFDGASQIYSHYNDAFSIATMFRCESSISFRGKALFARVLERVFSDGVDGSVVPAADGYETAAVRRARDIPRPDSWRILRTR